MEYSVSFYQIMSVLWNRRWLFIATLTVSTLITGVYVYRMPDRYTAEVTFMMTSARGGGGGGLAGGLGGIMPLMMGQMGDGKSQASSIMESRTMAERVAKSMNLSDNTEIFSEGQLSAIPKEDREKMAVGQLLRSVKVKLNPLRADLMALVSDTPYKNLAHEMVNAYLVEFQNYQSENGLTSSKRMRVFIEVSLAQVKEEMLNLSKNLAKFYSSNKVNTEKSEVAVPVAKIQLRGIRPFDSIAEYQEYFQKVQNSNTLPSEVKVVDGVSADDYLKYLMMEKSALEQTFFMLSQQLVSAKLDEAKEEPKVTVMDVALPAEGPSSPKRLRMIGVQFILISVVLVVGVILHAFYTKKLPGFTN